MSGNGLIYKKMLEVGKNIGAIGKNQKNTQQGYSFRGIDDLLNALNPALLNAGVFMTLEVISRSEQIVEVERSSGRKGIDKHVSLSVRYTFHAEDGSTVSSTVSSEGLDSGDKATNKALSAALKYALIQTFAVRTEDMEDGDSVSPEIGSKTSSKTSTVGTHVASNVTLVSGNLPTSNGGKGINPGVTTPSRTDGTPSSLPVGTTTKTTFKKSTSTVTPTTNGIVVSSKEVAKLTGGTDEEWT